MFIDAEDDRDAQGTSSRMPSNAAPPLGHPSSTAPLHPSLHFSPTPRSTHRLPHGALVPDSKYLINWAWNQLNIYSHSIT